VGYEQKGLELVSNRHEGKISSELEVAQQSALLNSTLTQLALIQQSRAQYEHAIAALIGQAASSFTIQLAPLTTTPPAIPLSVPSEVLERRPDIASFERQVADANAQVGLAKAAFYPVINLGASGGWQSRDFLALMSPSSLVWSIGADALQPIFEGGKNKATLAAARDAYNATVGNYRQSVLTTFQQVEDGISNLQTLAHAGTTQAAAVSDASKQLAVANNRYIGGLDTYLDVIVAQSTLLNDKTLAVQLKGQQIVSSVYLIKALGGGWDASDLDRQKVMPRAIQTVEP
jgi:NodT family efflux transporter outer membrane factor (OMF) lipoprotein